MLCKHVTLMTFNTHIGKNWVVKVDNAQPQDRINIYLAMVKITSGTYSLYMTAKPSV